MIRTSFLVFALSFSLFCQANALCELSFAQDKPSATPTTNTNEDTELGKTLAPLIQAHEGDVAVCVRHLTNGKTFEHRSSIPMGTASLIKLPIMIETYRRASQGQVDLAKAIEIRKEDMVPGSGVLTAHFSPGTKLSLRDAIHLMIAFSDNTATNLVLDQISIPATNATMKEWGHPETQIHSKVYRRDTSVDTARSERFGLGSTTAKDMVDLLQELHSGKCVNAQASTEMMAHLAACDDKAKFPALLPPGTKIWHKTGSVAKVRTDAGIIETKAGPVAICVLTENNKDMRWSDDNAGNVLCAEVAKAVYEHYSASAKSTESKPLAPKELTLAVGATGDLVEALQRSLNARSPKKPNLSVDGDFGSGTEKAVKEFQESKQIKPTGIVDRATWEALGPLLVEAEPVPAPDVVNSETLTKQPEDDPFGRPFVSCKSWVIADAKTGKTLWDEKGSSPLDIASTTKIMTAYLVINHCQSHPEALEETITFSERADKTPGSTAGLRAGERVQVKELLYGLMLPSGNDASVAFAEHFGKRLDSESGDSDRSPYEGFIAAMNRTAQSLGMNKTHYVNPHGLTAEKHLSTAEDLVKLTVEARKMPLFRLVTTTRQFGCTVSSASGYVRNVKWENTNQLLPIAGYQGVKTGTTDAAGACLVSVGARGDRELILVVLGSAASAARYTDSRNLYAWAWRELEKKQQQ